MNLRGKFYPRYKRAEKIVKPRIKFSEAERKLAKAVTDKRTRQARHFRNKYGITVEERDEMIVVQGGRCAVCRTDKPPPHKGWCVDHDHVSNKVRGILCSDCNTALGYFRDNPDSCEAAAEYLRKYT